MPDKKSDLGNEIEGITWGCERGRPYWRKGEQNRRPCSGDRRRPI